MISPGLIQTPPPGHRMVCFCGDTLTITLELETPLSGTAWVRTNLGNGRMMIREVLESVIENKPVLGRAWYDIPMEKTGPKKYSLSIGLGETGHFEAKCFFLESTSTFPIWPAGSNIVINVSPADLCCANIIYNAFVRQFGPNKAGKLSTQTEMKDAIKNLDAAGYTVIPPSGTFRDLASHLDFILGTLGCRFLHLLPINPTPTTYGRMGRFGSPYAALDFTGIDPALAVFDPRATPLEQFIELVDAVHAKNAKIIIDIAPNHTGWAAELHETHPEWLVRDKEGRIQTPGAWGVVWEDLTRLDYSKKELWEYMADVFLTWCSRGVDGFRCDAGYMIPLEAWNFIVAKVRQQFSDTIFFLEGLGGKISTTRDILNIAGFNWAYSELFQNYTTDQIESQLRLSDDISEKDGLMIHFAETHDNNRLASFSNRYAMMRTALCALCSHNGGFGFANGVEWFATEKIDVHDACSLNWGAHDNQVEHIRRLSLILKNHPAFFDKTEISFIRDPENPCVILFRHHRPSGKKLVILINPDTENRAEASWNPGRTGIFETVYTDLLTGDEIKVSERDGRYKCLLSPGQALCLTPDKEDLDSVFTSKSAHEPENGLPARITDQMLCESAFNVYRFYNQGIELKNINIEQAARMLAKDPIGFLEKMNPYSDESRAVTWQWPEDSRRHVMIPPGHFLFLRADFLFRAEMILKKDGRKETLSVKTGIRSNEGYYFAIFSPKGVRNLPEPVTLKISVFDKNRATHSESLVIYLPDAQNIKLTKTYTRTELLSRQVRYLGTNGRGAMMRVNAAWGKLESRYDALLAANLDPDVPVDRWMMLIRCRAWVVYQGYSQDVDSDCLEFFISGHGSQCFWKFVIPCGQGHHVGLWITAGMEQDQNRVDICFSRTDDADEKDLLANDTPVTLIVRPDVDNRSFHDLTKAYLGPEHAWPKAVSSGKDGFSFAPEPGRKLFMKIDPGEFYFEPEWKYMEYLPMDAERGADPHTDLFSPGYFSAELKGNKTVRITAAVPFSGESGNIPGSNGQKKCLPDKSDLRVQTIYDSLHTAMKNYIVKRNKHKTIIAGYPWFLDWGRDTLIVSRGLVAAGFINEAKDILCQFAAFEENGTLPNIIFGTNTKNRDTSDAPLWLVTACMDFVDNTDDNGILSIRCGKRKLSDILLSIVYSYISGTKNGICTDPKTGLVFSPSHFTWMDTDFPAGTPREGYPIEIQALWHRALCFAARIDKKQKSKWAGLAARVRESIKKFFYMEDRGYLADCLAASPKMGAAYAAPDDALRPNQLFAVTLGAVSDREIMKKIVTSCAALIVPGAIRSLADRPVSRPLPIVHNGRLLNDPYHPYQGVYTGDEDTSRKPAYHNGTAWTWVFPSFCEAWAMAFGKGSINTARAYLGSSAGIILAGSTGQVPEILDGDAPHLQRGCDAQAWGVSEWLRVWKFLNKEKENEYQKAVS